MLYEKFISISPRGQLVLPKKIRQILGLAKNRQLKVSLTRDNKALLEAVGSFTQNLAGTAKSLLKGQDAKKYVHKLRAER